MHDASKAPPDTVRVPPKERPILFSGPMVRAIIDGRKTQTRRVVRDPIGAIDRGHIVSARTGREVTCPFGAPGDRLWVRETWAPVLNESGETDRFVYRADGGDYSDWETEDGDPFRWKPSIFMRPAGCRLRLEVTGIRVERLHEISEEDARAEGCVSRTYRDGRGAESARLDFQGLWESINGKRAPWASSPWVWVVEFRSLP